ncbi:MAG: imidazolonepropionase [Betaproteobacteria bacterium]|nr:imidazolonepropionase [Betaproteobacteria bacterium]
MNAPARFDVLLTGLNLATLDGEGWGIVRDGAIGVVGERIAWIGPQRELPAGVSSSQRHDFGGAWATPGLVDCHTHLVYAGNRAGEFERRLRGATYAEIAREGGGILSTVRATRAADAGALADASRPRLAAIADEGATTVEVKSGYGLEREAELKQLAVARALGRELGVDVRTTLLAAHAVPPEFAGRADAWIDAVCADIVPAAASAGLADAVDAFCDTIGFTREQTRRVFDAAHAHGLPVKLHAEQLSDQDGAALAAEYGALSADHLEWLSPRGIDAMAASGTVAVLLPGAFYALRETRLPPVDALRERGVPMAVATDCNPGTSPTTSPLLMLNMACTLFRLTPQEALAGMTHVAARALGLADRGRLRAGMRADVAVYAIDEPAELAWRFGGNPCLGTLRAGVPHFRSAR